MISRVLWRLLEWPIGLVWWSYAALVRKTSRIVVDGSMPQGPAIFVNWHQHQAFLIAHHGEFHRCMLVSPKPVVYPIARFCRLCGLKLVYGTSGARGQEALNELANVLAAGESVTIAIDGPRGPAFEPKRGCADLALRANVPLVPVRYDCKRGRVLQWRWDKMLMPLPFDRITIRYGEPIAPVGDVESLLGRVGEALQ